MASMRALELGIALTDMSGNLVNYSAGNCMIQIFVTGGTFDKDYNELNGTLVFKDTHLLEMLRLGRSRVDVLIQTLMMIERLERTAANRQRVPAPAPRAAEPRILITHGTDPMVETAALVAGML